MCSIKESKVFHLIMLTFGLQLRKEGTKGTRCFPADGVFQSWSDCFEISSGRFYKKRITFFLMIPSFPNFQFLS
jgi:hypothetical protein